MKLIWAFCLVVAGGELLRADPPAAHQAGYSDLVNLFHQWREFQKPKMVNEVPDYSPAAMAAQAAALPEFQRRLQAIDISHWSVPDKVDYNLVCAEMNGLDFDHRVLHPWSRDPGFYTAVIESESDVPLHEGPYAYGTLELWQHPLPLSPADASFIAAKLQAIPRVLAAAKANLTEEHKDWWTLAAHSKGEEIDAIAKFAHDVASTDPHLASLAQSARQSTVEFRDWVAKRASTMAQSPAIGVDNYNWYLKNVHLVPFTFAELLAQEQRELQRSLASLALERQHNRNLPELPLPQTLAELRARNNAALDTFRAYMKDQQLFTVRDYMNQNRLRDQPVELQPAAMLDVFSQVEYRNSLPMKTHAIHWMEKQRLVNEPHASPIRSVPLLYNIWDGRSEGFATAWEEVMMQAGLYDGTPRARELVYFLVAFRCVRGIADLKMHSGEFSLDDAIRYVVQTTPNGWVKADSPTLWNDLHIYAHQPAYGTTYIAGKLAFDHLLAEQSAASGASFQFKTFMDQFFKIGVMPMSLIRWEMTGKEDEVERLSIRH